MNVIPDSLQPDRRTVADHLFDQIRNDIDKMRLLPGTKISEAEIAKRYDVSRQPVREAFIRLDNLSLLHIRPQKATTVRRMSKSAIRQARFVRTAVEIEVARRACEMENTRCMASLNNLLEKQLDCLENNDIPGFNELDHEFHRSICILADCEFAVEVINDCKAKVDRLCMLSLANENDARQIFNDHRDIVKHLENREEAELVVAIRHHLSRLDKTIDYIQDHHGNYFEE